MSKVAKRHVLVWTKDQSEQFAPAVNRWWILIGYARLTGESKHSPQAQLNLTQAIIISARQDMEYWKLIQTQLHLINFTLATIWIYFYANLEDHQIALFHCIGKWQSAILTQQQLKRVEQTDFQNWRSSSFRTIANPKLKIRKRQPILPGHDFQAVRR